MAIREINFSVSKNGISPNTEQPAGLQSEHAATQLNFTINSELYNALLAEKESGDALVYRFDCIDSTGGSVKTEPKNLNEANVSVKLNENITRNGGKVRVYLVITRYNSKENTETELLSFPAKLRFENVPGANGYNGDSLESVSTLAESAKNAAELAKASANSAEYSAERTEAARAYLDGGTEIIFDGGDAGSEIDVEFVLENEPNETSPNILTNAAIVKYVNEQIQKAISNAHPVGSYYWSHNPTNPALLFGGTWEQVKGRFILAAGQAEINNTNTFGDLNDMGYTFTVENTDGNPYRGGQFRHQLTIDEMPEHTHRQQADSEFNVNSGSTPGYYAMSNLENRKFGPSTQFTQKAGGNQKHNNMPPYEVAYCWRRTA